MQKKRILITGFMPFLNNLFNPSGMLAESLGQQGFPYRVLDVVYEKADKFLTESSLKDFEAVLSFGLASGRPDISIERYAYNRLSLKTPDQDGKFRSGGVVQIGGEEKLQTSFKPEKIASCLTAAGIANHLSENPGNYLCDFVYYKDLSLKRGQALFIHLPEISETMAFAQIKKAGLLIIAEMEKQLDNQ
jgi:pyroglutamyl-peptidase